jgi:hypothetical protein
MVLGPGHEDELYCPPDACVAQRTMPRGWAGPASSSHACRNFVSGRETRVVPLGFVTDAVAGDKGEGARIWLLGTGFSSVTCERVAKEAPSLPAEVLCSACADSDLVDLVRAEADACTACFSLS